MPGRTSQLPASGGSPGRSFGLLGPWFRCESGRGSQTFLTALLRRNQGTDVRARRNHKAAGSVWEDRGRFGRTVVAAPVTTGGARQPRPCAVGAGAFALWPVPFRASCSCSSLLAEVDGDFAILSHQSKGVTLIC